MELVAPHPRWQESYLRGLRELAAEGNAHYYDMVLPADAGFAGVRYDEEALRDPATFAEFCDYTVALALPETPQPAGWCTATYLWMLHGDEVVGRISLRHELTPWLREVGGHIGYSVRPSARRRGHATTALRLMLPVAAAHGIDPVLVTCDHDNVGSRKVIEANGGRFEDRRGDKLRYWIPTP